MTFPFQKIWNISFIIPGCKPLTNLDMSIPNFWKSMETQTFLLSSSSKVDLWIIGKLLSCNSFFLRSITAHPNHSNWTVTWKRHLLVTYKQIHKQRQSFKGILFGWCYLINVFYFNVESKLTPNNFSETDFLFKNFQSLVHCFRGDFAVNDIYQHLVPFNYWRTKPKNFLKFFPKLKLRGSSCF